MTLKKISATLLLALLSATALAAEDGRAAVETTVAQQDSGTKAIIDRALSLIGVAYRRGGSDPQVGLDCSGLVRFVFADAADIMLPRRARDISRVGDRIALADLQPGDLVFFNTLRRAFSHVGIYLGNSRFLHAPSAGEEVRIDDLRWRYWRSRFSGARRIDTDD